MLYRFRSFWTRGVFVVFLALMSACDLPVTSLSPTPTASEPIILATSTIPPTTTISPTFTFVPPTETSTPVPSTDTPAPTATFPPTSPPTPSPVSVKAVGGNLNIRRGPGLNYNPVGALLGGQSSLAMARNDDASWLYIGIPFSPDQFGWVSTLTQYSTVAGDAMSLSIMAMAPADPAYIRNCTFHEMLIKPVGMRLPPQTSAPANLQQFFPGEYIVFDQVTFSIIWDFVLVEGKTVDIRKDGSGNSYSCPS